MNYYAEIKDTLLKNEVYKKIKDYSKNKSDLQTYYEVGRLLIEAQGGEKRAQYGNQLIKEYSERLTHELGKGYKPSNLKNMRQFYLLFRNRQALPGDLSWSHCIELIRLNDAKQIEYYIKLSRNLNLSYRELREKIKSNEYERIGYKEELSNPKVNTLIKNPIIIKTNKIPEKITEYAIHQFILEDMKGFLKQLGVGFAYFNDEVKIKIGNNYHYIDFLLFNIKFNCYVVVELKITKALPEHVGQIKKYINYVDKHIKELSNNDTVGVILCKDGNKIVMDYCTDPKIFTTTYEIKESIR